MDLNQYHTFTGTLRQNLTRKPGVIGLVALGSMAGDAYQPDRWSDHDFFVITLPGWQAAFRRDLTWLPQFEEILFSFRETAHGLKVIYQNGHLLELAIFDKVELNLARVNQYRLLLDRGDLEEQLAGLTTETAQESGRDDNFLVGMFLSNIIVGAGRYRRGEKLSGSQFIRFLAMEHLATLLARHVPAEKEAPLDNLSPFRRFEMAYPQLGARLNEIIRLDPAEAAREMLDLAERELGSRIPALRPNRIAVARRYLEIM